MNNINPLLVGFFLLFFGVLIIGVVWVAASIRSTEATKQKEGDVHHRESHDSDPELISALFQAIPLIQDQEALFEMLTETIADSLSVLILGFLIYDQADLLLRGQIPFYGVRDEFVLEWFKLPSPPEAPFSTVWTRQENWVSNNVPQDTTVDDFGLRPALQRGNIQNILIVPLTNAGNRIGLLLAANKRNGERFEDKDIELATSIAPQCGSLLQASIEIMRSSDSRALPPGVASSSVGRSSDLDVDHDRTRDLIRTETLLRLSTELSTSLDLDRVLDRSLSLIQEVVPAGQGAILLIPLETDSLILRASFGFPEHLPPGGRPSPYTSDEGLAGWVIRNRQAIIIDDLTQDERWVPYNDDIPNQKSALVIPLIASEEVIGTIALYAQRFNVFTQEHLRFVTAAASQIAVAISNAELYALIRNQAEHLGSLVRVQQVETSKSRAILNSITDGVIVTDHEHGILLFNPAAERILGLARADVLGGPVFDIIGVYGTSGSRWSEAIHGWSDKTPSPDQVGFISEQIVLEDGRVIAVHPAPVVLGEEFLGTVSIVRDISREVEVDRLKSEFVATVSHELRTPMTSIKGFVDLLLMGVSGILNSEQRRYLDIVRINTNRLEILVDDLLDISRIESGRTLLVIEPISISTIFSEAEAYIHQMCKEYDKALEVEIVFTEDVPMIMGDAERVRQILENLVENSVHYTPSGGKIALKAVAVDDSVEIEVSDTGIGISLQEQNRIFERFYRGEQALNLGVAGTGLGLSIVLNLVEMHGGRIWVTSEGIPGSGTSFTVALPGADEVSQVIPETGVA